MVKILKRVFNGDTLFFIFRSMIRIILMLIFLIPLSVSYSQTFVPGGTVSGNWDKFGNPFLVQGDITVPQDSTLNIYPGVNIVFQGEYAFSVYGTLRMVGSLEDSILVTAADTNSGWRGLKIFNQVNSNVDSTLLAYSILEYAKNFISGKGGAIYTENSVRLLVSKCDIRNNAAEYGAGIFFQNAPVIIKNCRVWNNAATNRGGGLYLDESAVDVRNSEIVSNRALVGGGVYVRASDAEFLNIIIKNNESDAGGGGIVLHDDSDVLMNNCNISNNLANGSGGGMAILENSQSIFRYCDFYQNSSIKDQFLAFGGGIFITAFDNLPLFINCVISGNYSDDEGAGLYSESDTELIGCLITQNENGTEVVLGGGGLFLGKDSFKILNCTFSANQSECGSSIYLWEGDMEIFNSIFWDVGSGSDSKILVNGLGSPATTGFYYTTLQEGESSVGKLGIVELVYGPGMKELDPLFVDPQDVNYRLQDGSPCIDAGLLDSLAILIPDKDLDSMPRVNGSFIDMGCYENQNGTFINDKESGSKILVYPVPFEDILYIHSLNEIITKVELYSGAGKNCLPGPMINARQGQCSFSLNTSSLSPGVYVCRISTADGEILRVVIKK